LQRRLAVATATLVGGCWALMGRTIRIRGTHPGQGHVSIVSYDIAMAVTVEIHGDGIPPEAADSFRHNSVEIEKLVALVAEQMGVPWCDIGFVLAQDYARKVAEIQRAIGSPFAENMSTERVGGVARAKAIDLDEAGAAWSLVFDPYYLTSENDDPVTTVGDRYLFILCLCHEVAHVLIGRTRGACGFTKEIERPAATAYGKARNIAMLAVEEYRADTLASILLGMVVPEAAEGECDQPRRITSYDLYGDTHQADLVTALTGARTASMRQAVESFRKDVGFLDDAVKEVWALTNAILNLLGRAQAVAGAGGKSGLLEESLADLNDVADSFWRAWHAISQPVRLSGALFHLDEALAAERDLAEVGAGAVLQLWEDLGLAFSDTESGIWVVPA
jgi:hypothetical protein